MPVLLVVDMLTFTVDHLLDIVTANLSTIWLMALSREVCLVYILFELPYQ